MVTYPPDPPAPRTKNASPPSGGNGDPFGRDYGGKREREHLLVYHQEIGRW